jgi:hypothetical protein
MTDIIVVGYPKSGDTWVTRLVADLIACPVVGFWDSNFRRGLAEGADRVSDFRCFKAHHQLHELVNTKNYTGGQRIIYVIRDPRDVALSGAHYFYMERYAFLKNFFDVHRRWKRLYRASVNRLTTPMGYRIARMIQAVLHGDSDVHRWTCASWTAHHRPYVESGCLVVKYEDLLDAPERECRKMLEYLRQSRSSSQIKESIDRQSFTKRKASFLADGEVQLANFMRTGKKEQWKQELSKEQQGLFASLLTKELRQFGYSLET